MTLTAFLSAKGSPGVTTVLSVLGGVWPRPAALVAELDPSGGDLAARYGLAVEPGLVTLAAAARRDLSPAALKDHVQVLQNGVRVLVGPASAEQAHSALAASATQLGPALAAFSGVDVLADLGRVGPGSPSAPLLKAADLIVVVARPRADDVAHLRSRVDAIGRARSEIGVVLVGERPYPPAEVSEALGLQVLGVIADDPAAAAVLDGRAARHRGVQRSALVRSGRDLATTLCARLARIHDFTPSSEPPSSVRAAGELPSLRRLPDADRHSSEEVAG